MQSLYVSIASIIGTRASLRETLNLLDKPIPTIASTDNIKPIPFEHSINLNKVSFSYPGQAKNTLENISLEIKKGARIGFVGRTGSGKSTLLDIIMGLLDPKNGSLLIDKVPLTHKNMRSWQKLVAHVPQLIFLTDSSIMENIAFGTPKNDINIDKVIEVAKCAMISEFIESLPKKYNTIVGENGTRISGGQKQRIGIARALYKDADLIILDEASSALDLETENKLMLNIDSLPKKITLIIVAHRLATLKNCTQIFELNNSTLAKLPSSNKLNY